LVYIDYAWTDFLTLPLMYCASDQAQGVSFAAVKAAMLLRKEEAERIGKERKAKGGIEGSAAQLATVMDGLEDADTPMVRSYLYYSRLYC
jgi:hypothetical protein